MISKKIALVSVGISKVEHPQFSATLPMTSVGLHYIAEILRQAGHLVNIINQTNDGLSDQVVIERIKQIDPDFVFFSQFFSTREKIKKIISELSHRAIIVIGGHDATFHSQRLEKEGGLAKEYPGVDYLWQGEAEQDLLRELSQMKKQTSPIVIKGSRTINLDKLPILKHDDYSGNVGFLSTSRGCFKQGCDICTTPAFHPDGWRSRSVAHSSREIKNLVKAGKKFVFICADNFLGSTDEGLEWGHETILECKEAGLKVIIMTIKEQIIRAHEKQYLPIWQGTVFRCFLGIESGGKHVEKIGKRTDINRHSERSREAIKALYANNIGLLAGWINFKPDTTFEELEKDAWFLFKNGAEGSNFTNFCQGLRLYEGTKVFEKHYHRNYRVVNGEFDYDFDDPRIGEFYRFLMFKVRNEVIDRLGGLIYELTDLVYINQLQNTDFGIKYWKLRNDVNRLNYAFFLKCLRAFRDKKREGDLSQRKIDAFTATSRLYSALFESIKN